MRRVMNILLVLLAVTSPVWVLAQSFTSGTNVTIPDAGSEVCGTIAVTGVGTIDGTYGLESVTLKINHTWDGDLDIYLLAPDGTRVELSTDNGGSGDNYGNGTANNAGPYTVFIMTAGTNITAGTAPFAGNYIPEGDLGDVNNGQNANGTWSLCVTDDAFGDTGFLNAWALLFSASPAPPPGPAPSGSTCADPTVIGSIPYSQTGLNTSGFGDDYSSADACGSSYMNGDDYVFEYTPGSNECIDIALTNTATYVGLFILDGCPDAGGTSCIASATGFAGNPSITGTNLTGGTTYYFVVSTWPAPQTTPFDIDITACAGAPVNDDPCSATTLTVGGSCSMATYTTAGATSSAGVPAPGCASYSGSDVWFTATVPASGEMAIDSDVGVITDAGMAVYTGTCGSLSLLECDDDDSPNGAMSYIEICSLAPGTQIWIRFWEYGGDNNGTFDICAYDIGGGSCPVDQVIGSIPFTQTGLTTAGAGDDFSSADACGSFYMNGDDYVFEYTAAGAEDLDITLTNTGTWVGLFVTDGCPSSCSSSCISPTSAGGCTGTATNTSSSGNPYGTWSLPGAGTYYIIVSTNPAPQTTPFDIDIQPSSGGGGPIPGQDCSIPVVVCNSSIMVGNPGYAATGNICDFDGSGANDCTGGEKNSVWYQIDIANAGSVNFDIMPNDGTTSSCGTETDYDFVMWRTIAGNGTDPVANCSNLSGAGDPAIVACNFDPDGVTGVAPGGNAPAPINSCFDWAYEPTVSVNAGDQYILVVQNFSGSTQGFTLDFGSSGGGVISYTAPTTVYWTGGASTVWNNATNWGSCVPPACGVSGVVTTASATLPIVTGTENVNDLTINPGATLTLNAGSVLNVCGDFTNNGTLAAAPTSVINFIGTGTQNITGTFTGASAMGNVVVNKASGSVVLNNDVEIEGDFTTSSGTSVWDNNGLDVTLAGDFTLNAPGTFISSDTTSTLTFDGSALQQYSPNGSLTVNNVTMSNSGAGVNLNDNMILGTSGTLTLTNGVIITSGNRVEVTNTSASPAGTTTGNAGSYVQGNLRRYLSATGSFDLPVGHATQGYQRANITFTAATSIGYFDVRFDPWAPNPGALGSTECATTYDLDALDNGYWTITANASPLTGTYNTTLYNTNYTNSGPASAWTVMRSNGTWGLVNGSCAASTAAVTTRNGMSGFSFFSVAQATNPLPIELVSFTGEDMGTYNRLDWITATELNNAYFTLERSSNGYDFREIGQIDGAGTSTVENRYRFDDMNPPVGINYYRLSQTDFNDNTESFDIIAIENEGGMDVEVVPNPTTGEISFGADLQQFNEVEVIVFNAVGARVYAQVLDEEHRNQPVDLSELPAGIYTVILTTDGNSFVNRVVKK